MHITHEDIAGGLQVLVATSAYAAGLLSGRWWRPSRRRLEAEYEIGRDDAEHDISQRVRRGEVLRVLPNGYLGWCDAGSQMDRDAANSPIGFEDTEVMPAETSPGLPELETAPRPGQDAKRDFPPRSITEPGRTIYSELAALAAESVPKPPEPPESPEPVTPAVDPHWYANGQHWLAEWRTEWHEETARFDGWLPGYLSDMKASLEPSWSRARKMLEEL